jgi:DNA-binding Lrp family transcriptional regulator
MPKAFVLFNVEPGSEEEVKKCLNEMDGVKKVYVSYGVYDLIVEVEMASMEQLKELVTHRIRRIGNIKSTLTLMAI